MESTLFGTNASKAAMFLSKQQNLALTFFATLIFSGMFPQRYWIAPRDIPYGNDWAGEIASAIDACSLFLFLLSSKSNESRQCPKEVNLADNAGKRILCVALEDIEMTPALKYHLTSGQIMTIDSYDTATKIKKVKDVICEKLLKKSFLLKEWSQSVNP